MFTKLLRNKDNVVLLQDFIGDWEPSKWSLEYLKCIFKEEEVTVKIGQTYSGGNVPKESDCKFEKWKFMEFLTHLECFKDDNIFYYAGYHHLSSFQKVSEHLNFNWSWAGLPQQTANKSTIWLGSKGSFTPCHKDSYGCNLHAQIFGSKEWLLWPPDTDLSATRIPYEESSVFSNCDVLNPDIVSSALRIVVKAGEVLFIPKHWWHLARTCELSFSINTWISLESDKMDSLKEAISRILISTLKSSEECSEESWVNPGESLTSFKENVLYLSNAMSLNRDSPTPAISSKSTSNFIVARKSNEDIVFSKHAVPLNVHQSESNNPKNLAKPSNSSTVDMLLNAILTDRVVMDRVCYNILKNQV